MKRLNRPTRRATRRRSATSSASGRARRTRAARRSAPAPRPRCRPRSRTPSSGSPQARDSDLARLMEDALAATMTGRDLLAELRAQAEVELARARARLAELGHVDDQARRARADHPERCRSRDGTRSGPPKARTWVAWLLLAVFVALAGLTAALWRAQVKRQNDQAFAAQAASVGASVTTAVRRMDDLTLAARTLLGSQPDMTQRRVRELVPLDGRRPALQRRRRLRLHRDHARGPARRLPARPAPVLLPAAAQRRRPRHGRDARRADRPGPRPVPHAAGCSATRATRASSARSSSSPATATRCSRSSPRSTAAAACRARSTRAAPAPPAGSSACSTPSRSCARRSRGQTGVAVTLEREHAAVPENHVPAAARVPHALGVDDAPRRSPASARSRARSA